MIGTRRPDGYPVHKLKPGEYTRTLQGVWYAHVPHTSERWLVGNLSAHDVTEHDDGTITVSPSILVTSGGADEKEEWHGYLERGVWRAC